MSDMGTCLTRLFCESFQCLAQNEVSKCLCPCRSVKDLTRVFEVNLRVHITKVHGILGHINELFLIFQQITSFITLNLISRHKSYTSRLFYGFLGFPYVIK